MRGFCLFEILTSLNFCICYTLKYMNFEGTPTANNSKRNENISVSQTLDGEAAPIDRGADERLELIQKLSKYDRMARGAYSDLLLQTVDKQERKEYELDKENFNSVIKETWALFNREDRGLPDQTSYAKSLLEFSHRTAADLTQIPFTDQKGELLPDEVLKERCDQSRQLQNEVCRALYERVFGKYDPYNVKLGLKDTLGFINASNRKLGLALPGFAIEDAIANVDSNPEEALLRTEEAVRFITSSFAGREYHYEYYRQILLNEEEDEAQFVHGAEVVYVQAMVRYRLQVLQEKLQDMVDALKTGSNSVSKRTSTEQTVATPHSQQEIPISHTARIATFMTQLANDEARKQYEAPEGTSTPFINTVVWDAFGDIHVDDNIAAERLSELLDKRAQRIREAVARGEDRRKAMNEADDYTFGLLTTEEVDAIKAQIDIVIMRNNRHKRGTFIPAPRAAFLSVLNNISSL